MCCLQCFDLMPLPLTVSCFSKIQIGFTFLVPAHPGSPGQRAIKRVCVFVCVNGVSVKCGWMCVVSVCVCVYDNNNNSHDNVYGAVIMTKVIARVHPVHLMNVD